VRWRTAPNQLYQPLLPSNPMFSFILPEHSSSEKYLNDAAKSGSILRTRTIFHEASSSADRTYASFDTTSLLVRDERGMTYPPSATRDTECLWNNAAHSHSPRVHSGRHCAPLFSTRSLCFSMHCGLLLTHILLPFVLKRHKEHIIAVPLDKNTIVAAGLVVV
jgi:hypothetical protein